MDDLKGKTALVTGASRGLGRAIALGFAEHGCNVAINYSSNEDAAAEVKAAVEQAGARALLCGADIADRAAVETMVEETTDVLGGIDILVNNAGVWEKNSITELSDECLRKTMDINVMGSFYPAAAVARHMVDRRSGSIINVSSTAGQRGEAHHSAYAASKSAVIGMTKSLAVELAPHGVRVNCVAPGWFETDMSRDAINADTDHTIIKTIPLGRVGQPVELAGAVLFLASQMSSFVTGEVINVNGGAVLCG